MNDEEKVGQGVAPEAESAPEAASEESSEQDGEEAA